MMNAAKRSLLIIALALACSVLPVSLTAATVSILDTNFSALSNTTYANGATIGSAAGVVDALTAQVASNTTVAIADGKLALIRNTTGSNNPSGIYKSITSGASYGTLAASFTFSLANFGPTLRFHIDSSTAFPVSAGAGTAAVSLWINNTGNLRYLTDSGSNVNIPNSSGPGDFVFTKNTSYTISIAVDFTSATQDSWSFTLAGADSGNVVFSSGTLKTRAPNITPGVLAISTLDASGGSSAFASFSDITLSGTTTAVPEMATSAILLGIAGVIGALLIRRYRS